MALSDGAASYALELIRGMKPDPILTVSDWADRHRILSPRATSEYGRFRTQRTPYLREIQDALSSSSPVSRVTMAKSAQIGGTEAGNNWIGYVIDHSPGPMMQVMPTVPLSKRNSKLRIDPLIRDCPRLAEKVGDQRSRDSSNTMLAKEFPNGVLIMTGANSAVGLRSTAVRYLFLDEIDAYPDDVDGEGDPIKLCERAIRTFTRSKIFEVSTPTITGRSKIMNQFEKGDRSYYHVPCPGCGEMHRLRWNRKDEGLVMHWDEDEPNSAHVVCTSCGEITEEHKKTWMLENGIWVPEIPDRSNEHRSFHISAMYSPVGWRSWGDMVENWLDSQGSPTKLRSFVNIDLGETWLEDGEAPKWRELYDKRESYEIGTIPEGGLFLTAGVDVQGGRNPRLEVEIVAWGRNKESWSIDYFVIPGDSAEEAVWKELDGLLARTWRAESGAEIPIRTIAVDSGFSTGHVYGWVRRHPKTRAIAVKGFGALPVLLGTPKAVDITRGGRTLRRGTMLWPVGVNVAKAEFYGWARLKAPTESEGKDFPSGYAHFPQYEEEAFKQLTSEQIVPRMDKKGYRKYVWEVLPGRRNERLDCRVYARAAAAVVGMDRFREDDWDRMAEEISAKPDLAPEQSSKKRRRKGYLHRNRER